MIVGEQLHFIYGWRNKWSGYEVYSLGIIIGCAIISYYNEYAVIVGVLIGFFVDIIKRNLLTYNNLYKKLCISVILLLVICVPYLLNNYLYYNGNCSPSKIY